MKYRGYFAVEGEDRSGLAAQVAGQRERVATRLAPVRRLVATMSGKGGVGKSHVTAALALGLAERGLAVGVLDADLAGPTVARLLGARGPLALHDHALEPALGEGGVRVLSMDLLLAEGDPLRWRAAAGEAHVWRGALAHGTLRELLADADWGALDVLLVDLPPGTERLEDLLTLVPDASGVIAVTLPSEESRRAVERAMRAARAMPATVIGVVENMSGYRCVGCGAVRPLFPGTAGAELAEAFGVPLLARLPFVPAAAAPVHAFHARRLADALLPVLA